MIVRIGESEVDAEAETDVHFTGDGAEGGGGSVAGAKTACVAVRMAGGRLGGMIKRSCSSLDPH